MAAARVWWARALKSPWFAPTASFTIGGEVYSSWANLVLQLNGTDDVTVEGGTSSAFSFTELLPIGTPYTVTVVTQPPGQSCTVPSNGGNTNGPATGIANSDIPDVNFLCVPVAYTIGGAVSGLSGGTTVVLQDNGGNATTVAVNGAFTFSTSLAYQSPYAVTVDTQPAGERCVVTQGSGRMPTANVTNIAVACTPIVNAGLWTWRTARIPPNLPACTGHWGHLRREMYRAVAKLPSLGPIAAAICGCSAASVPATQESAAPSMTCGASVQARAGGPG